MVAGLHSHPSAWKRGKVLRFLALLEMTKKELRHSLRVGNDKLHERTTSATVLFPGMPVR